MSCHQVLSRIQVLILLTVFIVSVSGSCLNYGHSCWGAHGKRSGTGNEDLNYDNWLIAKLLTEGAQKTRRSPALALTRLDEKLLADQAWAPNKFSLQALQRLARARVPFRFTEENLSRSEGEPIPNSTEQEVSEMAQPPLKDQEVVFVEQRPSKLINILKKCSGKYSTPSLSGHDIWNNQVDSRKFQESCHKSYGIKYTPETADTFA